MLGLGNKAWRLRDPGRLRLCPSDFVRELLHGVINWPWETSGPILMALLWEEMRLSAVIRLKLFRAGGRIQHGG